MFLGLIVTLALEVGCTSLGGEGDAPAATSAREFVERFVRVTKIATSAFDSLRNGRRQHGTWTPR